MKNILHPLLLFLAIIIASCGLLFDDVEYLGSIKIPEGYREFVPYKNNQEVVFWDSLKIDSLKFRVSRVEKRTKVEYEDNCTPCSYYSYHTEQDIIKLIGIGNDNQLNFTIRGNADYFWNIAYPFYANELINTYGKKGCYIYFSWNKDYISSFRLLPSFDNPKDTVTLDCYIHFLDTVNFIGKTYYKAQYYNDENLYKNVIMVYTKEDGIIKLKIGDEKSYFLY